MRVTNVHPKAVKGDTKEASFSGKLRQDVFFQAERERPDLVFVDQRCVEKVDSCVHLRGEEALGTLLVLDDLAVVVRDYDSELARVVHIFDAHSGHT